MIFILTLCAGWILAMPVGAQTLPGDPIAGQKFAEEVCVACHFVESGVRDFSPNSAPSFQLVADEPAVTAISLRVFFRTPHQYMPNLILNDDQVDNMIAYILSLK